MECNAKGKPTGFQNEGLKAVEVFGTKESFCMVADRGVLMEYRQQQFIRPHGVLISWPIAQKLYFIGCPSSARESCLGHPRKHEPGVDVRIPAKLSGNHRNGKLSSGTGSAASCVPNALQEKIPQERKPLEFLYKFLCSECSLNDLYSVDELKDF